MAKRYWIAKWSMGYEGTGSEEKIDLHDWYDEKKVAAMTDEKAREDVEDYAWHQAKEMVDSYAEEDEEKNV